MPNASVSVFLQNIKIYPCTHLHMLITLKYTIQPTVPHENKAPKSLMILTLKTTVSQLPSGYQPDKPNKCT